jgi:hypothetical protein
MQKCKPSVGCIGYTLLLLLLLLLLLFLLLFLLLLLLLLLLLFLMLFLPLLLLLVDCPLRVYAWYVMCVVCVVCGVILSLHVPTSGVPLCGCAPVLLCRGSITRNELLLRVHDEIVLRTLYNGDYFGPCPPPPFP